MSVSDPLADMLTKIRNANSARHEKVDITVSKLKLEVIKTLKNEGFIKNFKKSGKEDSNVISIFLKYDEKQSPVLHGIESVSTPGRRMYSGYKSMPRVFNGFGSFIVSTSQGIMTSKKACELKIGGELLCKIW